MPTSLHPPSWFGRFWLIATRTISLRTIAFSSQFFFSNSFFLPSSYSWALSNACPRLAPFEPWSNITSAIVTVAVLTLSSPNMSSLIVDSHQACFDSMSIPVRRAYQFGTDAISLSKSHSASNRFWDALAVPTCSHRHVTPSQRYSSHPCAIPRYSYISCSFLKSARIKKVDYRSPDWSARPSI